VAWLAAHRQCTGVLVHHAQAEDAGYGPELNPKVQVEALVEALMEPLARKQRREIHRLLRDEVPPDDQTAGSNPYYKSAGS
jgi:hypothetical protein